MSKGIIASQLHFTRGATNNEFVFYYGNYAVGIVKRVSRTGNNQWQIEGEPQYMGVTREDAVTKLLSADLAGVLPPVTSPVSSS